jgi:hypothetical protein
MAVAFYTVHTTTTWAAADATIDSSFTKRITTGDTASARPVTSIADLDLSDTSSVSATWSFVKAVTGSYASIAIFKEPAAGGTGGIRNPLGGPLTLRSPLGI